MHFELVSNGCVIRAEVYCQQLERVYKKLKKNNPALINIKRTLFQQCVKPHISKKTINKFEELGNVEVLPHPAYNTDCAPSDYILFCLMQYFLKGR